MKEIKAYDTAASKFYKKQNFLSFPLGSWDLFSSKYSTFCKGLEEINCLKNIASSNNWSDASFVDKEVLQYNHIVVVTDRELNILHASDSIFEMNGYRPEEIIGQKPKMFQGEKTCKQTTKEIRAAISKGETFEATVLNYRKDGSTYNCWIKGTPIKNTKGEIVNFIAFEREVA